MNKPLVYRRGNMLELNYPNKKSESDVIDSIADAKIYLEKSNIFLADKEVNGKIYFGDNLCVLKHLLKDSSVKGKVQLVYIDPPFSTQRIFNSENGKGREKAYHDNLEGYNFIDHLRNRLILIKELLSDDGSIYVHLDQRAAHYVKIIMDEVFGESNFRNWITRQKCHSKNYTKNQFGNTQDFILFYTKSKKYKWNRIFEEWNENKIKKEYPCIDEKGRRYKKVPVYASGVRNGRTGSLWKGTYPPQGKHWQFTPEKLDEFDKKGDIIWSKTGNPRRKVYLDESKGIPISDIWLEFKDYYNQNQDTTGYPTEKNIELLKRILNVSSEKGDLILDCFAGSGTTLAASHLLGRRWIGIDNSELAIKTIEARLSKLDPPSNYHFYKSR